MTSTERVRLWREARRAKAARGAALIREVDARPRSARQIERRLLAEHEARMRGLDEEVRLRVVERGAKYREAMEAREREAAEAKRWYETLANNRKPPLTVDEFMLLHLCIRGQASEEKQHAAGVLLNQRRAVLTGRK